MNGTIEELNFQVLQMQEQIRKMQEDNEFRFQELEGGQARAPRQQEPGALPRQKQQRSRAAGSCAGRDCARRHRSDGHVEPSGRRGAGAGHARPARPRPSARSPSTRTATSIRRQHRRPATISGGSARPARPPLPTSKTPRSPRCRRPTIPRSSTATPTSSSCRATTARPSTASATISPASPRTPSRRMRITGWANRCSASRNIATRRRSSSPPTRTIRSPRRRPTCC